MPLRVETDEQRTNRLRHERESTLALRSIAIQRNFQVMVPESDNRELAEQMALEAAGHTARKYNECSCRYRENGYEGYEMPLDNHLLT